MLMFKKSLALLLAVVMAAGLAPVCALAAPEASMEQTVLADNDDITVTIKGFDAENFWGPTFELLLENKSDRALYFTLSDAAVDGIMCDPFWGESVPAGASAYSDLDWMASELEEIGVNYIQDVSGVLTVFDDDSYEDVYKEAVSWTVDVGETDVPPAEPVAFDSGFEAQQVIAGGDVSLSIVNYDPEGSYDGSPQLIFYMENHTDETVYFTIDDVTVNGFVCDPFWAQTVAAGKVAYGECSWWKSELEDAHVEQMETVSFNALVRDYESFADVASAAVTLDLADVPAEVPADEAEAPAVEAEAPADEAEAPADEAEAPANEAEAPADEAEAPADGADLAALMGTQEGDVYTNEYFGLTMTIPEGWRFYSQEEILEQQGLAAEDFEGTELGEQMEQFAQSDSGFSVMMAEKDGGLQNINILVQDLQGVGKFLSEDTLLTLMMSAMGIGEDGDMSALGLEGAVARKNTFSFAGEEHVGLRVDYTDVSMGIELPMYLQMVYLMRDQYVLQITMTTVFEDATEQLGGFFELES